jgi:hypothetical protein
MTPGDRHLERAYRLVEEGREEDAIEACRAAIAWGETVAWLHLGVLLHARDPAQAEAAYREAIAAGNAGAWVELAGLLADDPGPPLRPRDRESPGGARR